MTTTPVTTPPMSPIGELSVGYYWLDLDSKLWPEVWKRLRIYGTLRPITTSDDGKLSWVLLQVTHPTVLLSDDLNMTGRWTATNADATPSTTVKTPRPEPTGVMEALDISPTLSTLAFGGGAAMSALAVFGALFLLKSIRK